MSRDDLLALKALGFEEDELRALGLSEPAIGYAPSDLAEMYVRRSQRKDTTESLREQVKIMCRQAKFDGIQIRRVWFEQKSASKRYIKREEFEKATQAVIDGLSKRMYAFKCSRFSRRGMGQVGPILDQFDIRNATLHIVAEGLNSKKHRSILAFMSEQARDQARDIAEFTQIGVDANKHAGNWSGVAPYGLESVDKKLRHRTSEHPTSRRIADLLLKKVTPANIANTLNSENIRTRYGKLWRAQTIIALVHSAGWAGLIPNRERAVDEFGNPIDKWHRRIDEPLMGADGKPVSCGDGVVTYEEWLTMRAILEGRSRAGTAIGDRTRGQREVVAILAGIFRCPLCGGPLGNGGRNYNCRARQLMGESVCKGTATMRFRAETAVADMWMAHILALSPESPTIEKIAKRWLKHKDPATEKRRLNLVEMLKANEMRAAKLDRDHYVLGKVTDERFDELSAEISGQHSVLQSELDSMAQTADLSPLMDAVALANLWNSSDFADRRALLLAAVKRIDITPAKHRGDRTPIKERLTLTTWEISDSDSKDWNPTA